MHLDLVRDKRKSFPLIDRPEKVTSLRVWYCKYSTLASIAGLSELRELVIAGLPDSSLLFLSNLKDLQYFRVLHMPMISDLEPLSGLDNLETLSLACSPDWDSKGKTIEVNSLSPIAKLKKLLHLELFGVCQTDHSLRVIQQCRNLKSARFSGYPKGEIERFFSETGLKNEFSPKPGFEV